MPGVQVLQALARDVGVDLRRRNVRMAQQQLHDAEIGAVIQQMRGKSVTQRMRRHPHIINAALLLEGVGLLSLALAMTLNPHIRKMRFPQSRG